MAPVKPTTPKMVRSNYLPPLVILLTLAIFGGTIFLAWQHLRHKIREQIAGQHARILHALSVARAADDPIAPLTENPADQLFTMLETSQMSEFAGLLGTRLFDPEGVLILPFPETVIDGALRDTDLAALKKLEPVIHFHPRARLADHFWSYESEELTTPLVEVIVPLHLKNEGRLLGIAQYLLDGDGLAAEFAALDRHLILQALAAFLVGGGIIAIALALAFRKLQRVNTLLIKANQELALAAKTSALGTVTAHLIHGLKNPLFGLQTYMASRPALPEETQETDWQAALSSTRRMQSLVNEIVRVLREEGEATQYEISFSELLQIIEAKTNPRAHAAKIHFHTSLKSNGKLTNRQANLITLILENLIQNAIEATPPDHEVRLQIRALQETVLFEISDQGSGFPDDIRQTLFTPGNSTKDGGNGIGLAISNQLANHLGAQLELQKTGPEGSLFVLSVPKHLLLDENGAFSKSQVFS